YQLRGFDLANMTLIEGASGWIVIDPLTSQETAAFAMDFVAQHLGARPVSTMIFSHSHVDHFGGALGVISAEDAKARQVPVIAPAGFMEEATSENLSAARLRPSQHDADRRRQRLDCHRPANQPGNRC
ncbi:MBL fold metallo-hydrolase, partial [Acinetobacter baumannii]|uniref:MBL fold metallo-hydrolase n=1 Tax=Acinetobacter baumannii TaxID=470 RepID=UPI000AD29F56